MTGTVNVEDVPADRPAGGPATYVVACLAGHGIGPEVTAAASRALGQVSRQHGFRVDEVHPPFDTEALTRSGHPLPPATRRATRGADAVLVAGAGAPALDGVRAELELGVRLTRTLDGTGDSTVVTPLHEADARVAVERAFAIARARSGRVSAVGVTPAWGTLVAEVAEEHAGVDVVQLTLGEALREVAHGSAGVLVAEHAVADALEDAPRLGGHRRLTAVGYLAHEGPGLFTPTHGTDHDDAGQGVADPSEMLLATALLLAEGLGRRAAGEALEASLVEAQRGSGHAAEAGVVRTTREFVDAVLGLLPSARRDTEFAMGVTG